MVTEPTHADGGLLEELLNLLKQFLVGEHISFIVKNMCFSCHDTEKVQIHKEKRRKSIYRFYKILLAFLYED